MLSLVFWRHYACSTAFFEEQNETLCASGHSYKSRRFNIWVSILWWRAGLFPKQITHASRNSPCKARWCNNGTFRKSPTAGSQSRHTKANAFYAPKKIWSGHSVLVFLSQFHTIPLKGIPAKWFSVVELFGQHTMNDFSFKETIQELILKIKDKHIYTQTDL